MSSRHGASRNSFAHPIMDYNYVFADPILGGELTWNTNALSFTNDQDPTSSSRPSTATSR